MVGRRRGVAGRGPPINQCSRPYAKRVCGSVAAVRPAQHTWARACSPARFRLAAAHAGRRIVDSRMLIGVSARGYQTLRRLSLRLCDEVFGDDVVCLRAGDWGESPT